MSDGAMANIDWDKSKRTTNEALWKIDQEPQVAMTRRRAMKAAIRL